jgi:hypothetical protein
MANKTANAGGRPPTATQAPPVGPVLPVGDNAVDNLPAIVITDFLPRTSGLVEEPAVFLETATSLRTAVMVLKEACAGGTAEFSSKKSFVRLEPGNAAARRQFILHGWSLMATDAVSEAEKACLMSISKFLYPMRDENKMRGMFTDGINKVLKIYKPTALVVTAAQDMLRAIFRVCALGAPAEPAEFAGCDQKVTSSLAVNAYAAFLRCLPMEQGLRPTIGELQGAEGILKVSTKDKFAIAAHVEGKSGTAAVEMKKAIIDRWKVAKASK